ARETAGYTPSALPVTISLHSSANVVVHSTALVFHPPVTSVVGFAVTAAEGQLSSSQTVATFTDPGGAEALGDYSAMIDWGDGSLATPGTITFAAGTFTVKGAHTYAEESAGDHAGSNPYDITVTLSHDTAPNTITHSSATVSDPSVIGTGGFVFNSVEGQLSSS